LPAVVFPPLLVNPRPLGLEPFRGLPHGNCAGVDLAAQPFPHRPERLDVTLAAVVALDLFPGLESLGVTGSSRIRCSTIRIGR